MTAFIVHGVCVRGSPQKKAKGEGEDESDGNDDGSFCTSEISAADFFKELQVKC